MTLQNTDDLVVQRESGNELYSLEIQNLMAKLDDTDLMVVCRDETAYKITGADLKSSLVTPVQPIINTFTLIEDNPGSFPRFTDQKFDADLTMILDGEPVGEKAITAFVEGDLSKEFITDPITAITDSPVSSTYYDFPSTNASCKSIATDGAGHWIVINTEVASSKTVYSLGTGRIPVFGGNLTVPSPLTAALGVCGSTNGRFIMTGYKTSTNPDGYQLGIVYSDDYGATWTDCSINQPVATNNGSVPIGPTRSLFISTDENGKWFIGSGDSYAYSAWSIISTDNAESFVVTAIESDLGNTIYCANMSKDSLIMGNNNFYYISTDGGTTWGPRNSSLGWGFQCIGGSKEGTQLCARHTTGSQLARFVNGAYVETIDTASLTPSAFTSIVSLGEGIWLSASFTNVFKSYDDGRTWSTVCPVGVGNPSDCNSIYADGVYLVVGSNVVTAQTNAAYNAIEAAFTTLTVSGEKSLSSIPIFTAVTNNLLMSDPNYASGVVNKVVINGANSALDLVNVVGTWQVDQIIRTEPVKIESSKLYLEFDSNGDVSDLVVNKPSPGYVTTDNPVNLTLTFPATFPSGLTPDEELPNKTTLTVDVLASNDVGSSSDSATVQPQAVAPTVSEGFNIQAYTGTGNVQAFTTGLDAVNKPGLTWIKNFKANVCSHCILENGNYMSTDNNNAISTTNTAPVYTDTGFDISNPNIQIEWGSNADDYVAWSWVQGPAFDKVYYTGNATEVTLSHSLGSKPGFIVAKRMNRSGENIGDWLCYHSALGTLKTLILNTDAPAAQITSYPSEPTASEFTFTPNSWAAGASTDQWVFYLWAEDVTDIIKCGSFSATASDDVVECGFRPQFLILKNPAVQMNWSMYDSVRGMEAPGPSNQLDPNNQLPNQNYGYISTYETGFIQVGQFVSPVPQETIYIAIAAPVTEAMTAEEYTETALKFATYENRQMVECGNIAQQKRDQLILSLRNQGFELEDILKYL